MVLPVSGHSDKESAGVSLCYAARVLFFGRTQKRADVIKGFVEEVQARLQMPQVRRFFARGRDFFARRLQKIKGQLVTVPVKRVRFGYCVAFGLLLLGERAGALVRPALEKSDGALPKPRKRAPRDGRNNNI